MTDDNAMADGAPVITDAGDGVWTITLNRPHRLNALTAEVLQALIDVLAALADRSARAVESSLQHQPGSVTCERHSHANRHCCDEPAEYVKL